MREIYKKAKNHPTDPFLLKEDSMAIEDWEDRLPSPEISPRASIEEGLGGTMGRYQNKLHLRK